MKRSHSAAILLSGFALIAGCASVFGIQELDSDKFDAGSSHDAATKDAPDTSVAPPSTDAGPDGCGLVGTPDPPTADSPEPDSGDVTFIVAFDRADFGIASDAGAAIPVGYNLDRFCTVSAAGGNSCTTTTDSTDYGTYVVDKNKVGLDNAGFDLIIYLTTLGSSFDPTSVNGRLQQGQFGAIMQIDQYNGGANDTDVDVNFFPAVGLADAGTPGNFSPSDVWLADEAVFVPTLDNSIYHAQKAYVTSSKLVAMFTTLAITISVSDPQPRLQIALDEVIITADIVPATGSKSKYRLANGTLGGRWATSTFFTAVGPLVFGSSAICEQPLTLGYMKTTVCGARDIMANGLDDNTGKSCNALSAGMAFDTYAVDTFGKGAQPYNPDAGCGDLGDCP